MKYLFLLALCFCSNLIAAPYMSVGYYYNPDAHGITSNSVGHVAVGYEHEINDFVIDVNVRHESDIENSGDRDLISNESIGVVVKYKFQ